MKSESKVKSFWVGMMMLAVAGSCLAQSVNDYSGSPMSPSTSASDQQNQAKSLVGKRGEQQVDAFTGSFGYSIPINCAPARNGSEPDLALKYTSGGDNGWCGMGWKLDIGSIQRNTKDGFPITYSTATPPAPLNKYDDTKGFLLNMFGKESKLFSVATNSSVIEYRPEVDTDFIRCFFDTANDKWYVCDKSGNTNYFGQTANSRVDNTKTGWGAPTYPAYTASFYWGLDQADTVTGDRTTVTYTTYDNPEGVAEKTIYPLQIQYNKHASINGYTAVDSPTSPHLIGFQTEVRPDRRFSYRWGFRTEQNRRLIAITNMANGQMLNRYVLGYSASPATKRSLLSHLTVYGSDNTTTLPTQDFAYQGNPKGVSFGVTTKWNNLDLSVPGLSGAIYPFITQVNGSQEGQADLIDIDGDGLPDRVVYDDTGAAPYRYRVQRNLGMQSDGTGTFETGVNSTYSFGPTSSGGGGTASASDSNPIPDDHTWAMLNESHVRIRDINGDGLPDRVCDYWKTWLQGANIPYTYPYTNFSVMLNNGSGFNSAAYWAVSNGPPAALSGNYLYLYECVESGGVNTGFFDINGDGLPDRVMSMFYSEGAMTYFRVQYNTGTGFSPLKLFGPYHSQNYNTSTSSSVTPYQWAGIETPDTHMIDINGDGLPDRVMYPMKDSTGAELSPPTGNNSTYYAVEYNDGYSFEAINTSTSVPGAADQWPGVLSQTDGTGNSWRYDAIIQLPYVGMFDMNGDGLPDRVMMDASTVKTSNPKKWLVYLNNGRGFDLTPTNVFNIDDQGQGQSLDPLWMGLQSAYYGSTTITLMDINGDGLLDRVMSVYNNASSSWFLVQTNEGPFPDLLVGITNKIGGIITIAYKPSTAYDNTRVPGSPHLGSSLPFPMQTVSSVTTSDGINPPRTTKYDYAGGFYDGVRREFAGFAVVTNTDPSLRRTVTYFHQGGGRDYSALGEYQDMVSGVGKFAKRGMPYRVETYGNESTPFLYKVVLNRIDQRDLGFARYFPYITNTFELDYPAGGSTSSNTATLYGYDVNGNLNKKVLYGSVNISSIPNYTFTDNDTSDTQSNTITYAVIQNNSSILDHPDTESLFDSLGNKIQETKYTYNANNGTLLTKQNRICASGSYDTTGYTAYDTYGNAAAMTNSVGIQTSITFDSTDHMYPASTIVQAVGSTVTYTTTKTFDSLSGLLLTQTDPMGVIIKNTYNDPFFRLTKTEKLPYGSSTYIWEKQMQYALNGVSSSGNYVHVQVNNGDGTTTGFESRTYTDGFGRIIQTVSEAEQSGYYRRVNTVYDERGVAFLTTWPKLDSSGFGYSAPSGSMPASFIGFDTAGRVNTNLARVDINFSGGAFSSISSYSTGDLGSPSPSPLAPKKWSYANGTDPWWKIFTDEDGKVRNYQYDAFGRNKVIQEMSAGSVYATTTLKYDVAGNLTNIVNQNGENIYFGYDDLGNKVAMADPHLGVWTYGRDSAGRVISQIDGRGNLITNSYVNPSTGKQDPLGRVQVKKVYKSTADYPNTPVSTTTYTYDVNNTDNSTYPAYKGLLYRVDDSEGWEKNGYDTLGRLIINTRHINANNQDYTTTYAYNDDDKVKSIGYPNSGSSGPTVQYEYHQSGVLKRVYRSSPSSYDFYTANTGSGNANFDEFGHVLQWNYGNGVVNNRSYYSTSKRLQIISAGSSGSIMSKTYEYSAADDIKKITGTGLGSGGSSGTITAGYDELHRVTSYGSSGVTYSYDAVGNISTDLEPGGTSATYGYGNARKEAVKSAHGMNYLYDKCGNMIVRHGGAVGSQALEYDSENRLVRFSQVGAIVVEYGYDYEGARLWKRKNQTDLQVWIGKIYEEKDGKILFHVYADDKLVCTFEKESILNGGSYHSADRVGYYYHEDNINSSSVLSSDAGSLQEVNVYYPFGRTQTATPQAGFQVSRRFTGQILDAETGLYYYNFRYYDPELGRFIQPDDRIPDMSNPQSYNRYSYCINNPLRYNDPDGHGYWADVGGMFAGYYDAGAGLVMGTVHMVAHPISTAQGVATAVAHPINTGKAIASSVAADWNSGSRGQGKVVGNVLLAVLTAAAPGAQAGNLSKVEQLANASEKLEQASASVAKLDAVPAGGMCFVAGTLVATENGFKPIEDIHSGDLVWSYDEEANQFVLQNVLRTFTRLTDATAELKIGTETVTCTLEHPFWVESKGWIGADRLEMGDEIRTLGGETQKILAVTYKSGEVVVYNFEVSETHSYCVSQGALLVHNACTVDAGGLTSRAARRQAMRDQGIPTSQQPLSQSRNASGREYTYEVPKPGGGTKLKSVQQQTMDESHPGQPHWEAGSVRTDPATGQIRMNNYDRPKLENKTKSKVDYHE